MDIILLTTVVTTLFLVIGCTEPLAGFLRLPYGVVLAGVGILIGIAAPYLLETDLTDVLNPAAEAIIGLPIQSDVFLYVFLPTLLFQATLGVALRRMLDDWVPVLLLAVVAVIVSTFLIGYSLAWVGGFSLAACMLVGATVSTTDPSAVVSIFRSISAPPRLVRIIEGESLLNDAAAIALFGLFLNFVMRDSPDPNLATALTRFPLLIVGGIATGWVAARIALWLMAWFRRFDQAIVSISIALPYLAYIVAEQAVGVSGVIAVVAAGATLNLSGPIRLAPATWAYLQEVWSALSHWAGALIFILAALLIPRLLGEMQPVDLSLLTVLVVAAIVARALVLFIVLPSLSLARLSPRVEPRYGVALLWGGLRGAVTLALALAVTESAAVPAEVKRLVAILATGFVLFTLVIQGTTLRPVVRWLGLDKLSPLDGALSDQVIAVALQRVKESLAKSTLNYKLSDQIVADEMERFGRRLDSAVMASESNADILERDRITLGLVALADAERDAILERIRDRTLPVRLSAPALADAERLIEGTRTDGRVGYRRAARRSVRFSRGYRLALWLHNRLNWSQPLARQAAGRFGLLQSQRVTVRDLDRVIDARIRPLHGPRVAELLHELLSQRRERLNTALEGLRLQFPGYAEELERRFLRRIALRFEEREYADMREQGLVGAEVHATLVHEVATRRQQAEALPLLDLESQRGELVRSFPLFTNFDEEALRRVERNLETRYVEADHRIIEPDSPAEGVYFIATGAVELTRDGSSNRLGAGAMFGQIRMLSDWPTPLLVKAIMPSTLLVLDEPRFLALLESSSVIRAAVRESAVRRGIDPESLSPMLAIPSA